ncbi:DUF3667 domain-containing protein [Brevundimonas lutea]|uniref:DUF3667 domain-containing protein n=1 Tax=Brevundimonas lutea TaxID=2293980 RepID=UPI000F02171C|nr:DUF3667 domain-containing protein [Brevundimonas lutea]
MEIEGAGAAVTAGLAAGALERPAGAAGEAGHGLCSDCGHAVEGNFCSNCGQPTHVHRSLLHLVEELLHGVMHFDGRVWRTLPLLVLNPGRLTREWVHGKRARYVSPLAIFLFTIFLMFFGLSFAPPVTLNQGVSAEVAADVEREFIAGMKSAGEAEGAAAVAVGPRKDGLQPDSWQAQLMDQMRASDTSGHFEKTVGYKMMKKLGNPDLAIYKLQQTLYKFAFLLVPLSVPFVALLFLWRRGWTLYDHGVFVLYSLTFMAMLSMAVFILWRINGWLGGTAMMASWFIAPAHMFAQLKGAYSLSVFSALWRTVFLLVFCSIVLGLFITAILLLGLGV